jgi:hypothetical protein
VALDLSDRQLPDLFVVADRVLAEMVVLEFSQVLNIE